MKKTEKREIIRCGIYTFVGEKISCSGCLIETVSDFLREIKPGSGPLCIDCLSKPSIDAFLQEVLSGPDVNEDDWTWTYNEARTCEAKTWADVDYIRSCLLVMMGYPK